MHQRWTALAACFCLVACTRGTAPLQPREPAPYPSPIAGFEQWEKFPADCAGHRRGDVTAFAPGLSDYSVAYNRYDEALQSAVTLYFYPSATDLPRQQQAEQDRIQKAHGGRVVSRRSLVLERQGKSLNMMLITFQFDGVFAGKQQKLSSQLWLGFQDGSTFKVRSTAPVAQAEASEAAVRELLQCVTWAQ